MSFKSLGDLTSFINDSYGAKDNNRVFTFIEFIKEYGYENSSDVFIKYYKDYVTLWNTKKKSEVSSSDDDFVMNKMIDILKSITLDYSSYEEQDFIANIDWNDKNHIRSLITYYSRKIREITEFYRKKRNESHLIVKRNSMKGSTKSVEEIIYNKILDFVFNNRHIIPTYNNIRRDLMVSVENYVDTYSEYFDIPRDKNFSDRSRQEMLSANMNDVDYRDYLEISLVVSEILYSGNVYLEEIPLIAQLGMDLSQNCVGDMLALKDALVANTTINQIPLTEQVALKRKLYEKYLGCDLYYLYVDLEKNITMDVLCKAKNPTGNLLNCGSVDTATIESEQLELLTHIGLFFKPDKTSILKVSAKDYSWNIDEDKIVEDTIYIFPDPSKYGDIGNNKNSSYPLIMEYKLDYDIRNLSSGDSANDPLMFITDQGWRSYYSKQDDDFKLIKNIDYEYAFTSLANRGFIKSYQTDVWGNQFGLLKGYKEIYKKDDKGNTIYKDGRPVIDTIVIPSKFKQELSYVDNLYNEAHPMIINGGYFEDPYCQGKTFILQNNYYSDREKTIYLKKSNITLDNGVVLNVWIRDVAVTDENSALKNTHIKCSGRKYVPNYEIEYYKKYSGFLDRYYILTNSEDEKYGYLNSEDGGVPFDFSKKQYINENYHWTSLSTSNNVFYVPSKIYNQINFGEFGETRGVEYIDDYRVTRKGFVSSEAGEREDIIDTLLTPFISSTVQGNEADDDIKIVLEDYDVNDFKNETGSLFVRNISNLKNVPQKFENAFEWIYYTLDSSKVINIQLIYENIIVETEDELYFIKYGYDGITFYNPLINKELLYLNKKDYLSTSYTLVEKEKCFYIAQLELCEDTLSCNLHIYKFDCVNYTLEEIINFYDVINKHEYEEEKLDTIKLWQNYILVKKQINESKNREEIIKLLRGENQNYPNFGDFSIPYLKNIDLGNVSFTHNASLGLFLLSFMINDDNGSPFIYEYKFKISNIDTFHDTIESNVYSIGSSNIEDFVESRFISSFDSVESVCFPDKTITENIFEKIE